MKAPTKFPSLVQAVLKRQAEEREELLENPFARGAPKNLGGRAANSEVDDQIRAMYARGYTGKAIARAVGMSVGGANLALHRLGLRTAAPVPPTSENSLATPPRSPGDELEDER